MNDDLQIYHSAKRKKPNWVYLRWKGTIMEIIEKKKSWQKIPLGIQLASILKKLFSAVNFFL